MVAHGTGATETRYADGVPSTFTLIGCGYTATRLGRRLMADGHRVIATRRSAEGANHSRAALGAGAEVAVADVTDADALGRVMVADSVVVVSAAPQRDGDTRGEAQLIACAAAAGARRIVYVSSTGVYAPGDGQWVGEDWPLEPAGASGQRRLAAERVLFDSAAAAGIELVALRAAAIYGPNRGAHQRIEQGAYRIIGDGAGYVSRIHVDDLGSAIWAAARAPSGSLAPAYNVADELPTTSREYADQVADLLGVARPPSIEPDQASELARDLTSGDRRVDGRRLRRQLGLTLAYPTWREGVAQAVAEQRSRGAP